MVGNAVVRLMKGGAQYRLAYKYILISCTVLFAGIAHLYAQSIQFESIPTTLGLSQNFVNDIAADTTGFIWIATPSGLNRFDGYEFKTFKNEPLDSLSLGSNRVYQTIIDRDGALWVAHEKGLQVYNSQSGGFIRVPLDPNVAVRHLILDKDLGVIALDSELLIHQIKRIQHDKFVIISHQRPISKDKNDVIYTIALDRQNRLWINARTYLGLVDLNSSQAQMKYVDWLSWEGNSQTILNQSTSAVKRSNQLGAPGLVQGRNGQIFVYNENVLSVIDGEIVKTNLIGELRNSPPSNWVFNGYHDASNLLWLYSKWPNSAFVLDLAELKMVNGSERIFEKIQVGISAIIESQDGLMWATTIGNGIYKGVRHNEIFNSPPVSSKILTSSTYPIYKDEEGNVWLGTENQILVIPKGFDTPQEINIPKNYYADSDLGERKLIFSVKFIKGDGEGGLWVGNHEGLHHLKKNGIEIKEHRFYSIYGGSRTNGKDSPLGVYDLFIDEFDAIWLATAGEIGKFDAETGSFEGHSFESDFKIYNYYRISNRILKTKKQTFWIGTMQGLIQFDSANRTFQFHRNNPKDIHSLASNEIKTIAHDPSDPEVIWIATNGRGLDRLNTRTGDFLHYTEKDGLPDETIYGILNNGKEELWLSTNKGLCSFNLQSHYIQTYSALDGLQDNEFNTRSFFKGKDNEFIFGGIYGLNRFYPDQLFESNYQPMTSIIGVKVNNESITYHPQSEILSHAIEEATDIYISPDVKMVSFTVSGLDLSAPENTNYQYKLENYDENWNTIGKERVITFTNLPYGDFKLRIRSSNRSGKWSDKTRDITIHMIAPLWQRWWAYTAYAAILILVIISIFKFQLKRENSKRESQRLQELDTLKTRLFTNITHEFRTPITVISGMAGMIPNQEQYTGAIQKNADNLLQMVNQILDLAKLESNKLEVNYINGNIVEYIKYLTESLRSNALQQNKHLSFHSSHDVIVMDYDEMKTRHIIYNLLSNALKFTKSEDRIDVRITLNGVTEIWVEVEDSGIGIAKEKLPYIFDRFYQADNSSTKAAQGTGIGLALCHELIRLLGGRLQVKSDIGLGSTFGFALLIKNVSSQGSYTAIPEILEPELPFQRSNGLEATFDEKKPLLLLVEDNYEIARFIELLLEGSYSIVHAENGQRGIEEAILRIPDVIISDVMMPLKNGYEVTETLKTDIRTSHIPIILLTAKASQSDRNEGLEKGADAYLHKPFDKAELQIRLRKLIELRRNLISKFKGLEVSDDSFHELENQFLQQVKNAVIENINKSEFKIEDLENSMKLSKMQLYRKLKALTGMSPSIVVRDIRLNEAIKLIRKGELSVSEVAYEVGFSDPSYFTRAFKEKFGTAPSKYN